MIDPSVTSTLAEPDLEGIYFSDGIFYSGTGDGQLKVRGSVVTWTGIMLERDMGDESSEHFEYAPDQYYLIPTVLGDRRVSYKEVAPCPIILTFSLFSLIL